MNLKRKAEGFKETIDQKSLTELAEENWHIGALTAIVFLGFMLRYMPENGMNYLQAADPFMIYRVSQHVALEGSMPQLDFSRYFPYAMPTYLVFKGDIVIPAILYKSGFSVFFSSFLEFGQFYPAFLGALSVLVMYFLGREYFDRNTGLAAAFFLAVTSAALRRTSAGFFEKEPIGVFLMLTSLFFFTRAWKRESWINGIMSGISLGLFTVSWGGSQLLWLMYPIITGIMLLIDREIRPLIAAYTPTVLIAGFFAPIVLYRRFGLTSSLFLASMAVLAGLWLRYLVGELELIDESYLPYFTPSLSVLGGIAAILSPLYSDFVAGKVLSVIGAALGSKGGVIAGTVQENAPPGTATLARDLGFGLIGSVNQGVDLTGMVLSPWAFMVLSVPIILTSFLLMLGRRYNLIGREVSGKKYLGYLSALMVSWIIFIAGLAQNIVFMSAITSVVVAAFLLGVIYFLNEGSAISISSMFLLGGLTGAGIFVLRYSGGLFTNLSYLVLLPLLIGSGAFLVSYYFERFPDKQVEFNWYLIIPLVWVSASIFGGTTRSRLVFLSSFAVALGAGYGLSKGVKGLRNLDYTEIDFIDPQNLKYASIATVVLLVLGLNIFSGLVNAQSIRGSPSPSPQIWEPSLDYMRDAPEGSVTLSWWDYGYHFQTLGRTASIGDGGQGGYYTSETRSVNMPLARYLNTTDRPEDRKFIEKHSADYIWLDHSMIGKFSAVSQIANRDNSQFDTISQLGTPGSFQNVLSSDGNQTVIEFGGRLGRSRVQVFAPITGTNTSLSLEGPATVRVAGGQTAEIGCILTEEGKKTYEVENGLGYCLAEDPFYSLERGAAGGQARAVLVPRKISESTFVRLYIQDGYGIEYAEKIPEASNGYIKMWEIKQ